MMSRAKNAPLKTLHTDESRMKFNLLIQNSKQNSRGVTKVATGFTVFSRYGRKNVICPHLVILLVIAFSIITLLLFIAH